ncbi:MAG TPA: DNA-deoxyinosine glycosylase [Methylophaga sp.]|nr:DNA-deoxyinosine glycosylase [Methylophaga sp.]
MSESLAQSFDWLAAPKAQILIIGSMPGIASLQQQQYYAHPRNAFWPIMQQIFDWPDLDYTNRCQALINENIALWDVLRSCRRRGSLDSNIDSSSLEVNDFEAFFRQHPKITKVLFNGGKAAQLFQRHVKTTARISMQQLPSTSPAHAAMSFQDKLEKWRLALNEH